VEGADMQYFLYQLGENYFEKYERLCLNNFINKKPSQMMWCPTPGCSFLFEMAEKFNNFTCQLCNKK